MPREGVELSELAKHIIADVRKTTNGAQSPEVVTSMGSEFYFSGTPASLGLNKQIARRYEIASASGSSLELKKFLRDHPDGYFAKLGRERLKAYEATGDVFALDFDYIAAEERLGLSAEDRKLVQNILKDLGYDVGLVDGAIGPKTRKHLKGFQKEWGLMPTGYVEPTTWKMFQSEQVKIAAARKFEETVTSVSNYPQTMGMGEQEVKTITEGLLAESLERWHSNSVQKQSGTYLLEQTFWQNQISRWQKSRGLEPTGQIDAAQTKQLLAMGRNKLTASAGLSEVPKINDHIDYRLVDVQNKFSNVKAIGYFGGNLYVSVSAQGESWWGAQTFAEKLGGHLVVFSSRAERVFIDELLKDNPQNFEISSDSYSGPAVGYYQKSSAKRSSQGWTSVTGEPIKFIDWVHPPEALEVHKSHGYVYYFDHIASFGASDKLPWETNVRKLKFEDYPLFLEKPIGFVFEFPPLESDERG